MAARDTRTARDPAAPEEDALVASRQITNAELVAQIALLQAEFDKFRRDTESRLGERSAETSPAVVLVPLKSACSAENYERARRMCERGLVTSRKFGGRWIVDAKSVQAALTAHISWTDVDSDDP